MFYGDFPVKAVSNSGLIIHIAEVNCFDALQIADVGRVYSTAHPMTPSTPSRASSAQIPLRRHSSERTITDSGRNLPELHCPAAPFSASINSVFGTRPTYMKTPLTASQERSLVTTS